MKLISILMMFGLNSFGQYKDAEGLLKGMYNRYAGKWYKSFVFIQTTDQYRNDSIVKSSTWYEAIVFPDKFRIDFGEKKDSNAVIFLKDSVYNFRKGKLLRTTYNDDNLTFLLGGMYFLKYEAVREKIIKDGYDITKFYMTDWLGKKAFIIGANEPSEKSNQIWIDKEKLVIVKFIKFKNGEKEEGIFSGHKKFGNAWSETACDFYVNDKLIQREIYNNCQADVKVNEAIFEITRFVVRD